MKAKKEINVRIGRNIRIARENANLTQEKFAEMISVATKNVSDIERGVVGISISSLIRICEVLSVSSDDILFGRTAQDNVKNNISERLDRLPPKQFELALDIINKLFEVFASSNEWQGKL